MKYGEVTLGQIEAIINKLGGMDYVRLLLSGKIRANFVIWKTIKLGTEQDHIRLYNDVVGWGHDFTQTAKDMMYHPDFTVESKETEIDLVVISGYDLGFSRRVRFNELCDRAISGGLDFCPSEVGPQVCHQGGDLLLGHPELIVAMKPITDGERIFFIRRRDRSSRIDGRSYSNEGAPMYPWEHLIFSLPRSK
ncbi:MAG: hypothetical protein NUV61_04185 [Candidatus Azambacteria bacterium]|nr:hypothetical protein [Candidatus Azambacteria bacterium]